MKLATAFKLGRVSNLPTVWTNTLAGAVLAGAAQFDLKLAVMLVAFTLFYVGGMFLNDAYDADVDAQERSERPIPSGEVSRADVFQLGFMQLGIGIALLFGVGFGWAFQPGGTLYWPGIGGIALAAAIIAYNKDHKNNPLSPFVMGLCRVLVYVSAALCIIPALNFPVVIAALLVLCYLIGLTYVAKQENLGKVENMWPLLFLGVPVLYGFANAFESAGNFLFWLIFTAWVVFALRYLVRRQPGDVPRAVVSLIAGISLFDAMLIAQAGFTSLALIAVAAFALTLVLQAFVSGT